MNSMWQPAMTLWLDSTGDASSPVSVRRQTFTTSCQPGPAARSR